MLICCYLISVILLPLWLVIYIFDVQDIWYAIPLKELLDPKQIVTQRQWTILLNSCLLPSFRVASGKQDGVNFTGTSEVILIVTKWLSHSPLWLWGHQRFQNLRTKPAHSQWCTGKLCLPQTWFLRKTDPSLVQDHYSGFPFGTPLIITVTSLVRLASRVSPSFPTVPYVSLWKLGALWKGMSFCGRGVSASDGCPPGRSFTPGLKVQMWPCRARHPLLMNPNKRLLRWRLYISPLWHICTANGQSLESRAFASNCTWILKCISWCEVSMYLRMSNDLRRGHTG